MERTSGYKIPSHILDDLCSRFILNVPDDERSNMIRLFFSIELAHWFFIDFIIPETPGLKIVGIKEFANQVFKHCPFLKSGTENVDDMHQGWKAYKLTVPTYGAVILDPSLDYVLLVQGFSKSWGFPKGKVNEDEDSVRCAVREVVEEIGFDISSYVNEKEYVEYSVGDQRCLLYMIHGVSLDTEFHPQTRNEIKAMQWFPIEMLPNHKKDVSKLKDLNCGPNSFFMVIPFLKQIKRWIANKRGRPHSATPKSQRKTWRGDMAQRVTPTGSSLSQSQIDFSLQSLADFEEILHLDAGAKAISSEKPRRVRRDHGSPLVPRSVASQQYTLLTKEAWKDENIQKVKKIRKSLDQDFGGERTGLASLPPQTPPFKPCKQWSNFKLNISAIMKAANLPA